MPIVKCGCKECKFYDDRFYCIKDVVELKTYGQCVEGIKIELNKALEEQRTALERAIIKQKAILDKAIEEETTSVSIVPYYNTYLGGGDI